MNSAPPFSEDRRELRRRAREDLKARLRIHANEEYRKALTALPPPSDDPVGLCYLCGAPVNVFEAFLTSSWPYLRGQPVWIHRRPFDCWDAPSSPVTPCTEDVSG